MPERGKSEEQGTVESTVQGDTVSGRVRVTTKDGDTMVMMMESKKMGACQAVDTAALVAKARAERHIPGRTSSLRPGDRIVWKRDPAILNGFVPTELWATVKKIRAPLIYILGGASNIVPAQTQMDIRRELPQAEIVMMPGLGHYPSDEKPAEFIAIVERFLADAAKPK